VSYAIQKGKALNELSLSEYKQFSSLFGEDAKSLTIESAIAARDNIGGTAPKQVNKALARAKKIVSGGSS
jgi:argininosuccinate lyase